jgi:hypothetical protein
MERVRSISGLRSLSGRTRHLPAVNVVSEIDRRQDHQPGQQHDLDTMNSLIPEKQTDQQRAESRRQFLEQWDRTVQAGESRKQQAEEEVQRKERRTSERHAYPVVQMLAPCNAIRLPEEDAFREVRCHDISRGGFSFLWSKPPDFEFVVVSLGNGSDRISLTARVVRSSPSPGLQDEFLVCCEFLDRVKT